MPTVINKSFMRPIRLRAKKNCNYHCIIDAIHWALPSVDIGCNWLTSMKLLEYKTLFLLFIKSCKHSQCEIVSSLPCYRLITSVTCWNPKLKLTSSIFLTASWLWMDILQTKNLHEMNIFMEPAFKPVNVFDASHCRIICKYTRKKTDKILLI